MWLHCRATSGHFSQQTDAVCNAGSSLLGALPLRITLSACPSSTETASESKPEWEHNTDSALRGGVTQHCTPAPNQWRRGKRGGWVARLPQDQCICLTPQPPSGTPLVCPDFQVETAGQSNFLRRSGSKKWYVPHTHIGKAFSGHNYPTVWRPLYQSDPQCSGTVQGKHQGCLQGRIAQLAKAGLFCSSLSQRQIV